LCLTIVKAIHVHNVGEFFIWKCHWTQLLFLAHSNKTELHVTTV
jgi:hypothetical protein